MTSNDMLALAMAWTVGLLLGAVFFGGLWWTVRKSVSSKAPALWLFVSVMLRSGMALIGIYLVSERHWQRMLMCMLGFIVARPIVTWLTRSPDDHRNAATQGASRAP